MRIISFAAIVLLLATLSSAQDNPTTPPSSTILNIFVGEWEGSATAYYPRQQDKEPREEKVEVVCRQVLKDTYIECNSVWKQTNGDNRELITFWNYDAQADSFQILFLYDNWPGKVNYPLYYDEAKRSFTGRDTFMARGGIPAEERVEWYISEDGDEIRCIEYNHYQTDPDDYWPKTFEFIWRRK